MALQLEIVRIGAATDSVTLASATIGSLTATGDTTLTFTASLSSPVVSSIPIESSVQIAPSFDVAQPPSSATTTEVTAQPAIRPTRTLTTPVTANYGNSGQGDLQLTTVFTPHASCPRLFYTSLASTLGTLTCTQTLVPDCLPPSFADVQWGSRSLSSSFESVGAITQNRIYSPGVCPSGYKATASWTRQGQHDTSYICCPIGMGYFQTIGSCYGSTTVTDLFAVEISRRAQTYTGPLVVLAPPISIAWASNDLPNFTPASAPIKQAASISASEARAISLASKTASTKSTHTPSSQAVKSSERLSTADKAGIGVGISLGILILVAIAMWALRRRHRGAAAQPEYEKAELPAGRSEKRAYEAGSPELEEFAEEPKPVELDLSARYELDGQWEGHELRNGGQSAVEQNRPTQHVIER